MKKSEKKNVPMPRHRHISSRRAVPPPRESADYTPCTSEMDPARLPEQHAHAEGKGREGTGVPAHGLIITVKS